MLRHLAFTMALIAGLTTYSQLQADSIPRTIPPKGIELPEMDRSRLESRLDKLQAANEASDPDIAVYLKAVRYALDNDEFYHPREIGWAGELLDHAEARIQDLQNGKQPWRKQRGLVVRGYRSKLDGSAQPYGLVIPEKLDLNKPVTLYVWLHGRGDKTTDLQFIYQRQTRSGTVTPEDGIVLHPYGRYCNAFKFAGEVDIFESIEATASEYGVDPDRIVLWGFSMGGAGVWHIAAHHPDMWVAASPGAGFAETKRYQNLKPENYPVWYEQTLWNLFDVPNYTRNLFNLPVIVYSGEMDKQIQAARVMEEAYQEHGKTLPHLIGPGMGHKYHPETLKELSQKLSELAAKGRDNYPRAVTLQTQTLRYNRAFWVEVLGLVEHWSDSRVDAHVKGSDSIEVVTKNVTSLRLASPFAGKPFPENAKVTIDGQSISISGTPEHVTLSRSDQGWQIGQSAADGLHKTPGLQGPIDDVFMEPFLVVTPDSASETSVDKWVAGELEHLRDRWRRLFRGELPEKPASQVTDEDLAERHVILWGTPASNSLIARMKLPIGWDDETLTVREQSVDAASHVPALIYPNPLNRNKYVVINSGMTFRESHDRTNSLQNPKFPDWAVIDITVAPDDVTPGRIVDAGFFDEGWRFKPQF